MTTKHPLHHAQFLLSVASAEQLPVAGAPEIAVAGRSNSGKSSAINALANHSGLAFASKTPGRTQHINFFQLQGGALLTDLPGYGYAAVPRALTAHWQEFLARYVATRQSLVGLVLTVDCRHGFSDPDQRLLEAYLPSGRPALLLATKLDKLASGAQRRVPDAIAGELARSFPLHAKQCTVVGFSATRRIGIASAEAILADWLDGSGSARGRVRSGKTTGSERAGKEKAPRERQKKTPRARRPAREQQKEKAPRSRGLTRGPKNPR